MAPLALLVVLAAVGYAVSSATREDEPKSSSSRSKEGKKSKTSTNGKSSEGAAKTTTTSSQPKTYTVKPGDTLGMIAEQTGVSVAQLQELNPDLDPQSLTVGERIRLR